MRHQPPRHDTLLAVLMVLLVLTGGATAALTAPVVSVTVPRGLVGLPLRSIGARPREGSAPVTSAVPTATSEAIVEHQSAGPSLDLTEHEASVARLTVGRRARITKTDGVGVILHAAPQTGARRPAGFAEGTAVTILELADTAWARVRADSNQEGWVSTAFLVAADE